MQVTQKTSIVSTLLVFCALFNTALAQQVIRGPYLQVGTPETIIVKWRTDLSTNSAVRYGTSLDSLDLSVAVLNDTTEHEVGITGLTPDTRYYYSIGTTSNTLAGGDSSYFWLTSPTPGSSKPTRLWIIGDSGRGDERPRSVRDAYYNYTGDRHTDLWLTLGDNAYPDGSDEEYQLAVFENMFEELLRKSVIWSSLGNHDDNTFSFPGPYPYYDIFTLPKNGEAGGVASGTEGYYSFDYANVHFICLDSNAHGLGDPNNTMWDWLAEDLLSNDKDWTIVFFHHAPYTKGSHDSDDEQRLIEMREVGLPLLEDAGVDLVLAGHSHSYERSFLINGHYGDSKTLTNEMILDSGDGRNDGDGAYKKIPGPNKGTVYVVVGSSGRSSGGSLNHPIMVSSLDMMGSAVLDIDGNRIDARFIDNQGNIVDYFTMVKGLTIANFLASPLSGHEPLAVSFTDQSLGLITSYNWDFGDGTTSMLQNPPPHTYSAAGIYTVSLTVTGPEGSDTETRTDYVTVHVPGSSVTASFQDGVDGYSGARDTKLRSDPDTRNFGSSLELEVDGSPAKSTLLYWDLTSIPSGSMIDSVSITLEITNRSRSNYKFYEMKRAWVETEATWNEYATDLVWEVAGADDPLDRGTTVLGEITASSSGPKTIRLNAAGISLVQSWVKDPFSNYGFILLDYTDAVDGLDFFSRETGSAKDRPKLTVSYSGVNTPVAAFDAAPLTGNAPLEVSFADQSLGFITSYDWDFGDGTTSTLQNPPPHTYNSAGIYTVSLTVTGPQGSDTETRTEYISVKVPGSSVTVSLQEGVDGYSGARDTKLRDDPDTRNFGSSLELEVDGSPDKSILLYWDLASIPPGSIIDSVSVTFEITNRSGSIYEFYEMRRAWVENEATWNVYATGQSWEVSGADGPLDRGSTVLGEITVPNLVTTTVPLNAAGVSLIQSWVNDPLSNNGFILLDYTDATDGLDFFSRETVTAADRPKLTITYSSTQAASSIGSELLSSALETQPTEVPHDFELVGNYPNPFNSSTMIVYELPEAIDVQIIIYNSLGRQVAMLVNGRQPGGQHEVEFSSDGLPTGIYIVDMEAGRFKKRHKVMFVK